MPDSREQLDLLLLTVVKARKVHPDGIHFQGLRYVDTTLAAYIGESVVLRYDPRDVAEIRVFHEGRFICRAICPDLAGETIPLREVLRARNHRRRELRNVLHDRKKAVDALLELKQSYSQDASPEEPSTQPPEREEHAQPGLRRYKNE
jgi:putative transposase